MIFASPECNHTHLNLLILKREIRLTGRSICAIGQVHLKDNIEMRHKKSERLTLVSTTGKTGKTGEMSLTN